MIAYFAPVAAYISLELATGNLFSVSIKGHLLNLLLYIFLYVVFLLITGAKKTLGIVFPVIFEIIGMAEGFVYAFRTVPITIWDIMAVRTAATVAGNYEYHITIPMAASLVFTLIFCGLVYFFVKPGKKMQWKKRIAGAGMGVLIFISGIPAILLGIIPAAGVDISMWNIGESYETSGFLLCMAIQIPYMFPQEPQGYSKAAVRQIKDRVVLRKEDIHLPYRDANSKKPENIICIMNESYTDFREIGKFSSDINPMEFYDSLEENCIKGYLAVPVFGAMTANTEYEFLTGNAMAFAPEGSVPYQLYLGKPVPSLASSLKEQGYRTVALHPYPGENWNRKIAYANMGFDLFIDQDGFEEGTYRNIRNYMSDSSDFEKIIKLTESKTQGEPLFIFNVTMQNHGGYEDDYEGSVHLTEGEHWPKTEQYLSLLHETDLALEELISYYSACDEPTMIVMFGDHMPSVEIEFYEKLYGEDLDTLSPEKILKRYETPFLIWTNYESESKNAGTVSAFYLSEMVLERAGLVLSDFMYYLADMQNQAPVVHMLGYYDRYGIWQSWTDWRKKEEADLFSDFWIWQYQRMFHS